VTVLPLLNEGVPKCGTCQGVLRPDVVLFGEAMPANFWAHIQEDFQACDLFLVFGTSLVVSPFNTLVGKPKADSLRLCQQNHARLIGKPTRLASLPNSKQMTNNKMT